MPALTEARRALPRRALPGWSRKPSRRWWRCIRALPRSFRSPGGAGASRFIARRRLPRLRQISATIRTRRYDEIIDSQGLLRSALIARAAHGRRHGYDRNSIREPLAALFYDVRHSVSRDLHAVERNRILTGRALGYTPQGAPDYGLDRAALAKPGARYALLLHATARPEKEWPEATGSRSAMRSARNGLDLVLPWGSEKERARAERIAAGVSGAPRRGAPADREHGAADRRRVLRRRRRYRVCCMLRRRSACRWWRSLPAAIPD